MCICLQHVQNPVPSVGNYFLAATSVPGERLLGTAIYVHNQITYDTITVNADILQISAVALSLPDNKKLTICNVYNQPSENYDLGQFPNIVNQLQQPLLIVGDFNAHHPIWDSNVTQSDLAGDQIESLIENHSYCCLNEENSPTYASKTHGTMSSIDLALCSPNVVDQFDWIVLDDLYTSDHFPIIIEYIQDHPTPSIPKFNFEKADWNKFDNLTMHIDPFNEQKDHNESNTYFTEFVINAAKASIPMCKNNPRKRTVPWWNEELSDLVKKKHFLSRHLDKLNRRLKYFLQNKFSLFRVVSLSIEIDCLKPQLNRVSAIFRKKVIENRRNSWNTYITNLSDNTNQKQLWHRFRKVNGSHIRTPRSPLLHNGIRIHSRQDISNIIGRHLESVGNSLNLEEHFRHKKANAEKIILNFETSQELTYNSVFTTVEIEAALLNCENSAPGKDMVSFELLKHLNIRAKMYLLSFYNHLWKRGLFPKAWRHAIVIPIAKPGKDPSHVTNYRPISLTSCLCKLMEKMVNSRLMWYIEKNNMLSPSQSGVRKKRSTLDCLASLESEIKSGFKKKEITVAVFFDIHKAFDTTWRYSILKTLHDNHMRGELPIFIKNFLTERTFQTRVDATYSDSFDLIEGVPQGSVLSGTLFVLAINGIVKVLPKGVKNSLFVDDFAIFYTSHNLRHIQRILNLAINKIQQWTASVGFKFSVDKTKAIKFYRDKRWLKHQDIELTMGDSPIPFYPSVKFLGLHFDEHLNWKTHVKHVKAQALKAVNLLKKLSHTTWGTDRATLLKLYKSTVLPILEYGSPVFSSASDTTLKTLNSVHHLGLRLSSGAFRSSPTESLIVETGDVPLSYRFQITTMRRALKIKSGPSPLRQEFLKADEYLGSPFSPPFPVRANRLLQKYNMMNIELCQFTQESPPWTTDIHQPCDKLYSLSKKYMSSSTVLKQHVLKHIAEHGNTTSIFTDGSKSENGVGYAVSGVNLQLQYSLNSQASVYTAELQAIKTALAHIVEQRLDNVIIYTDSRSSIEAIKNFTATHAIVCDIRNTLHKLKQRNVYVNLCWIPSHIGVEGNEKADKLAKEAVTLPCGMNKLPLDDYLATIKKIVRSEWQDKWNAIPLTNKLRNVKDTINPWLSSFQAKSRREETILTRLRIGHTNLTHGYLMCSPHDPVPICNTCNVRISVKHILIDCQEFTQQRLLLLRGSTLKEILSENKSFSSFRLFKFLQLCNIYKKI